MRPLALHQLTVLDVSPLELVSLASAAGCQRIVTWVHDPVDPFPGKGWPQFHFPSITPATKSEMKQRLSDNGIELANIEMFPIAEGIDVERYRPYLEMGAELGAARAVVHVHDPDDNRAVDTLRKFCEIAAEYKLGAGIEFMGLIQACKTLERGLFFAKAVDMPNVGVALDFLHVVRSGATVQDVANVPAKYISYAQICDGPHMKVTDDYLEEGLDRLPPGEGVWPVKELVEAIPAGVPMDIEVPLTTLRDRGWTSSDRVRRAVNGARAIVETAKTRR
jgi:sugar phosphate isomerase/epimerase